MIKNIKKKQAQNSKLTPSIAPGSTIDVTVEEIEKRKRKIAQAEEIRQEITKVDSKYEGYENPYRAKALYYIASGQEVTKELKKMIIKFDIEHNKKNTEHKRNVDI